MFNVDEACAGISVVCAGTVDACAGVVGQGIVTVLGVVSSFTQVVVVHCFCAGGGVCSLVRFSDERCGGV